MPATNDEIQEMQKEWRAIVLNKLDKLEEGQNATRKEVSGMKADFTNVAEFLALKSKVEALENFKAKAIGIVLGIQAVVGVILWLAENHDKIIK
jgi:hypothetical protein